MSWENQSCLHVPELSSCPANKRWKVKDIWDSIKKIRFSVCENIWGRCWSKREVTNRISSHVPLLKRWKQHIEKQAICISHFFLYLLSIGKCRNLGRTIHFTKWNQGCGKVRLVLELVQNRAQWWSLNLNLIKRNRIISDLISFEVRAELVHAV